jgi:hypothetical protein
MSTTTFKRRQQHVSVDGWTALDARNPTYNFLIEYYGLKGTKGPRRLARWSPDPALLLVNDSKTFHGGILLEGACEDDLGDILHLRGAIMHEEGIVYCPRQFYSSKHNDDEAKAATAFLWYESILQNTIQADPILHCYGLHEWAMQYWPEGADAPPSAKYQHHLPLRASRETINETVERRGVNCTHVDALRFFAPAAASLNHHGYELQRIDQLRLEQPACVHANMDLLKIALKLQPFIDAELVQCVLELVLKARRLDVAASPYDASEFGVEAVPVETPCGRSEYKKQQLELMKEAEPVRQALLRAYQVFLGLAFDPSTISLARENPKAERFAKAAPGSAPWRQNLITS